MAPDGVEPSHADSKPAALSTELRGRFGQSSAPMDTESAARRWRETWLRSWRSKDVGAIAALYAPGARPVPAVP